MVQKRNINIYLRYIYIFISFIVVDAWLRFLTRELGLYGIGELAPNLFTLFWALLITNVVMIVPRKMGRVLYGILYFLFSIYSVVQYVYYMIFGKFLFFSDFLFAGEGANYIGYVLAVLTPTVILQIILLIAIGIVGIIIFPKCRILKQKGWVCHATVFALTIIGIMIIPKLYGFTKDSEDEIYRDIAFEYERFVNSAFDMQLTGVYQYIAKDAGNNINKLFFYDVSKQEAFFEIEEFFAEKDAINLNDMTGIFEGKNVIVVMMESVDDWLVTEEDMPTVYYMMSHGINFTNMYTPNYSSGYTINTEFAFNTSVYPLSKENYVYTLVENNFSNSIANVFKESGYAVNSYHYNNPEFYNRGELHPVLGYEKYYSFLDYCNQVEVVNDDRFVYLNDELYADLVNADGVDGGPFMSFLITSSAHLPYVTGYSLFAEEYYGDDHSEEAIIRAKAHVTDDMFKGLLIRLEEDGLLEDTVVVGYTDHYAYGFNDKELLQQFTEDAGSAILERTPAFIYCADMEESIIVDKVTQITDLAPTVENLLGLTFSKYTMGNDVFNDSYEGYAIFMNNTWITNEVYMKDGVVIYNNGMSKSEIEDMNEFVKKAYLVNDYLLEFDFYNEE